MEPNRFAPRRVSIATDERFARVSEMLRDNPNAKYAVLSSDGDPVTLTIGIRGRALCEMSIPRAKWDGVLFMELLERHGGTNH
jgi:hypothetical protein